MEKRKKKEHDFSITAFRVVQEATGQIEKQTKTRTFDAVALGRLGGLKGGRLKPCHHRLRLSANALPDAL